MIKKKLAEPTRIQKIAKPFELIARKVVTIYRPGKIKESTVPKKKFMAIQAFFEAAAFFFCTLFLWGLIRGTIDVPEFVADTLTFFIMTLGMITLAFIHIERDRQRIMLVAEKEAGINLENAEKKLNT